MIDLILLIIIIFLIFLLNNRKGVSPKYIKKNYWVVYNSKNNLKTRRNIRNIRNSIRRPVVINKYSYGGYTV